MGGRTRAILLVAGLTSLVAVAAACGSPSTAGHTSTTTGHTSTTTAGDAISHSLPARVAYLGSPAFYNSSFAVVPGSTVSLHWSGGSMPILKSGVHLVVTSSMPGFASPGAVSWPTHTSPAPTWTGAGWDTTAAAMKVTVPASSSPGTRYQVSIEACAPGYCAKPESTTLSVPASPTTWTVKSYRTAYSKVASISTPGFPFAATFLTSNNSIWNASEYSHNVIGISSSATKARNLLLPHSSSVPSAFRQPFASCDPKKCEPSSTSALSEQVAAHDGWVWTTFGGWRVYANGQRDTGRDTGGQPSATHSAMPPNHSELVALNPSTGKFCAYLVPGDNTQVAGITAIGSSPHTQVWFVASDGPGGHGSLDEFNPATVGKGCTGRRDQYFVLPASVKRLTWPNTGAQWPAQLTADPSSPTLWVTNFNPYSVKGTLYSGIDRIDISDPSRPTFVARLTYPSVNASSYFGAKPWDIVAPPDSNYVYAADNGDAQIVRINKTTNQLQEIPVPLASDLENAFGLSYSSGKLYFALADDYQLSFGKASTFGYIDLNSWPDQGTPATGVVYSGLTRIKDPPHLYGQFHVSWKWQNFRAIAVGPTGQVALTDNYGIIRFTP